MNKIVNLFLLVIIVFFFVNIFSYYLSNKNIKKINLNRTNIDQILNKKISNLSILDNDTDNVIIFNESFSKEIKKNKPRNFWNLLKNK